MRNHRLNLLLPIIVFAIALPLMPGCSSQQHSETTTTTTEPASAATTSETTTTTTTTDEGHDSVLGATAHFVWTVVAFPFRVVGDVLGEIV